MIIWACYCAGWWYNHVLDKQGNKTQQYDKLKRVNARLHAIGETYMQYQHSDTYFIGGFEPEELAKAGASRKDNLNTAYFSNLHMHGEKLIVGKMKPHEGEGEALFIVSADDSQEDQSRSHEVTFRSEAKQICLIHASGKTELMGSVDGTYSFELDSCQCAMLIAE